MELHLLATQTNLSRKPQEIKKAFDEVTIPTKKGKFYVDDCLKSVPTNPKAGKLVGKLHELLSRGGFRLTKWISNSKKVMDSVPESEKAPSVKNHNLSENVTLTERVLRVQ